MTTDKQKLVGNWNYPTHVRFGPGEIEKIDIACAELQITRPLLVTDNMLVSLSFVQNTIKHLSSKNLSTGVFSDVKSNPTGENIRSGIEIYRQGNHDGVIAFGGGSSLDAGKAIALMSGQTLPLWEFEDINDNWKKVDSNGVAPVIAIPTTSGTGSEVGRAAVILDTNNVEKKIIFHPLMMPKTVIADPALTIGLSSKLTAATGMDALSHNLEALCAPSYHPMAEGIALEALRLIKAYLPTAVHDGKDLTARSHMLTASLMGATSFQKGLGATHALAHPLGAFYDTHHGLLNAVLMPYILAHNRDTIEHKMQRLANILELHTRSYAGVLDWILNLRKEIQIPHSLSEIGISSEHIDLIARQAVNDPSSASNPLPMHKADYVEILSNAISGKI